MRSRFHTLLSASLWLLGCGPVALPAPARGAVKLSPPAAQRLQEKISVSYIDAPLIRALEHLQRRTGVCILVDRSSLSRKTLQQPISLNLENVRLKEVLDWLGKIGGIGYRVEGRVIFVSSLARTLAQDVVMKVYDVSDLVEMIADFPGPDFALEAGAAGARAGKAVSQSISLSESSEVSSEEDAASLAEMIQTRIEPESWSPELGTYVNQHGTYLIVRQTPAVHRKIKALLSGLRRMRLRMISFSVRVYESTTETTAELLKNQPRANFLNAAGLKKLGALAEEGTITLRGVYRTTCFNTQRITFTAGVQQNYVVDFEIAGGSFDPVVKTFHDGLVFDIRPIIVGSRREILAELRITHLEVDDPVPVVTVGGSGGVLETGVSEGVLVVPGPLRMHVPRQAIAKTRTTIRIPEGAGAVFTTPLRGSDRRGKRELLMIVQPKVVDLSVRGR